MTFVQAFSSIQDGGKFLFSANVVIARIISLDHLTQWPDFRLVVVADTVAAMLGTLHLRLMLRTSRSCQKSRRLHVLS
jgi:hypothetical protein